MESSSSPSTPSPDQLIMEVLNDKMKGVPPDPGVYYSLFGMITNPYQIYASSKSRNWLGIIGTKTKLVQHTELGEFRKLLENGEQLYFMNLTLLKGYQANMLLFEKATKQISRYDPSQTVDAGVDKALAKFLSEFAPGWTYIGQGQIKTRNRKHRLQTYDLLGSDYCMLYVDLRLEGRSHEEAILDMHQLKKDGLLLRRFCDLILQQYNSSSEAK